MTLWQACTKTRAADLLLVMCLHNGDGRRSFKSTKKIKHKEAEAVCDGWQRAVDLSKYGTLTEVQARKVLGEIYERANQEPIHFTKEPPSRALPRARDVSVYSLHRYTKTGLQPYCASWNGCRMGR